MTGPASCTSSTASWWGDPEVNPQTALESTTDAVPIVAPKKKKWSQSAKRFEIRNSGIEASIRRREMGPELMGTAR